MEGEWEVPGLAASGPTTRRGLLPGPRTPGLLSSSFSCGSVKPLWGDVGACAPILGPQH